MEVSREKSGMSACLKKYSDWKLRCKHSLVASERSWPQSRPSIQHTQSKPNTTYWLGFVNKNLEKRSVDICYRLASG